MKYKKKIHEKHHTLHYTHTKIHHKYLYTWPPTKKKYNFHYFLEIREIYKEEKKSEQNLAQLHLQQYTP